MPTVIKVVLIHGYFVKDSFSAFAPLEHLTFINIVSRFPSSFCYEKNEDVA